MYRLRHRTRGMCNTMCNMIMSPASLQLRAGAAGESACRPGSVHPLARADGHPSGTAVAGSLVRSTREHRAGRPRTLAQAPRPEPRGPSDLAPGGVYLAAWVTPGAGGLLHHRFTLTPGRPEGRSRGGLLSVALSRGSPRVGVTDHPALRSPDLPHRVSPARPPGRLTRRDHQHRRSPAQFPADNRRQRRLHRSAADLPPPTATPRPAPTRRTRQAPRAPGGQRPGRRDLREPPVPHRA
jgi:hypothetical protein